MSGDQAVKRIEELFAQLRHLRDEDPVAPESWGSGQPKEMRRNGTGKFVTVKRQHSEVIDGQNKIFEEDVEVEEGPLYIWEGRAHAGDWVYVEEDGEKIQAKSARRHHLNDQIAKELASIDPRELKDMDRAYGILCAIGHGLGHGAYAAATPDSILSYLESVSIWYLQWAMLFVNAAIFRQDFTSAENLLQALHEPGGAPLSAARHFAHAKALHPTLYLGKAMIAACHQQDPVLALEWIQNGKRACAGVPGAMEGLRLLGRRVKEAQGLIASGKDEDEVFLALTQDKQIKEIPLLLTGSVEG